MVIRNQIQKNANEILQEQSRVERIKKYIEDTLTTDLRSVIVSKKFELSVSSLLHVFKKHQRQSYHRYVEKARMNKAMELIKEGKWIQEIMDATGYKSRSTFYRAFKKIFKHSPRHFQK